MVNVADDDEKNAVSVNSLLVQVYGESMSAFVVM